MCNHHMMEDDEKYGNIEDEIFGGMFAAMCIETKPKKQVLYEKELNKYKKDKATTENIFYLLHTKIPMGCISMIKDYSVVQKVYIQDYMTRCPETYLKLDKCTCEHCVADRKEHADYLKMEQEEREDHYMDVYYDW